MFPAGEFWLDAQSVETEVLVGACADGTSVASAAVSRRRDSSPSIRP
ncbi:hypothetical protein [Halorubrum lacusprofundi]|nr:hypothetical protein [Halorubrum lacusprofundi]